MRQKKRIKPRGAQICLQRMCRRVGQVEAGGANRDTNRFAVSGCYLLHRKGKIATVEWKEDGRVGVVRAPDRDEGAGATTSVQLFLRLSSDGSSAGGWV